MTLRIVCGGPEKGIAYAEEVTNVHPVKLGYLSLLRDPVDYTDMNGRIWTCEKSEIIDETGTEKLNLTPVICQGVYRITY